MAKVEKTLKKIHLNLPHGAIRDLLSSTISYGNELHKDPQQRLVDQYKAQLAELQLKLKQAELDLAIITLAEEKDWGLFDVSDQVPFTSDSPNTCPPFIGTQEEHDRLFKDNG